MAWSAGCRGGRLTPPASFGRAPRAIVRCCSTPCGRSAGFDLRGALAPSDSGRKAYTQQARSQAREQEAVVSDDSNVLSNGQAGEDARRHDDGSTSAQSASTSSRTPGPAWERSWREQHSPTRASAASADSAGAGSSDEPASAANSAHPPSASAPPAAAAAAAAAAGHAASTPDAAAAVSSEAPAAPKKPGGGLANRIVFGALLGAGGAAAVLVKQLFIVAVVFITYHATIEYYSMVTSKGITRGMAPPSTLVSSLTTVMCVSMVMFSTIYTGRSGIVLAVASFFLMVMNMVAAKRPTFSMLASTLFGVFYCGWLPSFWVKLRWLATPAPDLPIVPALVSPFAAWTVGLLATFVAILCVVAADVGAFFVGKTVGRTKLTDISPKKTVEGALGGLASSVATAVAMQALTQWPVTPLAAAVLGVVVFFSSLFGDLIESIIKRDAQMKDSGDMIPGHGGLLDRFDSYIFTGAMSYCVILYVHPAMMMM